MTRAQGVQFGIPDRGKGAKRQAAGRPCDFPGCSTVLSVYNRSNTCWTHSTPETRHPLHRR
jgi:hypothetical protein